MSFEYRELSVRVFNARQGDPCQGASCQEVSKEGEEDPCDCGTCGTTTMETPSVGCYVEDDAKRRSAAAVEYQNTLGLLRQQLRDSLAAG